MSNVKVALQTALRALDLYEYTGTAEESKLINEAEKLCFKALAEIERCEPVAWRWKEKEHWFGWTTDFSHYDKAIKMGVPIENAYTSPQPRE